VAGLIQKRLSLHKRVANQQCETEALKSQVSRLQAMANIGATTCMIAHEINNLLAGLGGFAQHALNNPQDSALSRKVLAKTAGNCERAGKVLDSMVALANGEARNKETCNLKSLIDEIFACLCRDFSKDGIRVNIEVADSLTVCAVPVQLQQVLMNLILNAHQAMLGAPGSLSIKADQGAYSVWVEVIDTGCGIDKNDLDKIFEPFFTTKAAESKQTGTGLGLAFCKHIIEAHNGIISVQSKRGKGTKFRIILPKGQ